MIKKHDTLQPAAMQAVAKENTAVARQNRSV